MGKGREREELSLNSPDCELVYCLLSYTASKRERTKGMQDEDLLDSVRTTWTYSLCQPPGISLTLCLVGIGTQRAQEKDPTPVDRCFSKP